MKMDTMKIWHEIVEKRDMDLLESILADDSVFYSPLVHVPQKGKELVKMYLHGAMLVLVSGGTFRYLYTIVEGNRACLEFFANVDGVQVNGVDLISWGDDGKIREFKVMLRPMKAINLVREKMAAFLEGSK